MKMIRWMLLVALGLAACKSNDKVRLSGQEWELKKMEGMSGKPERMPSLLFTDSTAVFGFAGCNRFFGTYAVENENKLRIHPEGATMMSCPDMAVEDRFLKELERVVYYSFQEGELQLKDSTGKVQLVFVPLEK